MQQEDCLILRDQSYWIYLDILIICGNVTLKNASFHQVHASRNLYAANHQDLAQKDFLYITQHKIK